MKTPNKNAIWLVATVLLAFMALPNVSNAQLLIESSKIELIADNGTSVAVYPTYVSGIGITGTYYYLPFNYRVSTKKNGTPEFSLLTYTENEGSEIKGGLMHLLLTWGPSPGEENRLNEQLRSTADSTGVLSGSAMVEHLPELQKIEILSDHPVAELLRRSLSSASPVPLTPYSKQAVSFSFSANDAKQLSKAIRQPEKLESVIFRVHFTYLVSVKEGFTRVRKNRQLTLDLPFSAIINQVMSTSPDLIRKIDSN